jgi:hypothetical protein
VVCVPGSAHCRSSCRFHGNCFLDTMLLRTQRAYPSPPPLKEQVFRFSRLLLAFLGIPLRDDNDMLPREYPSNALDTMPENPYPSGQDDFDVAFPGANCWVRAFVQSQEETLVDDHRSSFVFDPVSRDLWSYPIHDLLLRHIEKRS